MGFYCQIYALTRISKDDGKASTNHKDLKVPKEYRRFLDEKGPWYLAYMREDMWYDNVDLVYDQFPSWEKVKQMFPEETKCEYGWTKEDHDLFHKALRWFIDQGGCYIIQWG